MITEIEVKNFKSLQSLNLSLGRVNVLIGENGSGKSNILEAIALGAAACSYKLDHEFLYSRGIRVTRKPEFMRSAYSSENVLKAISLKFQSSEGFSYHPILINDNKPYGSWLNLNSDDEDRDCRQEIAIPPPVILHDDEEFPPDPFMHDLLMKVDRTILRNFLIYSPEYSALRVSDSESQIHPLGIKGQGLFRYLTYLNSELRSEIMADIKKRMQLLQWFENFEMPMGFPDGDSRIEITDRYIAKEVGVFDQLSVNEGFLFIMFYFCLVVGPETPTFFAIDNIESSLNPKLCSRVMKELVELAKKYDKQMILTTHNPAILDGLNLDDDEQRLFVVRRNRIGETLVKRILKPKTDEGAEPVRLSEAFLRGYIGGLPDNF